MANLPYTRGVYTKLWLVAGLLWLCCLAAFGQCAANFSLPYYTNFYSGVMQLPSGGYVVSTTVHRDTVLYIEGNENTRIGLLYLDSCGNELNRLMLNTDSLRIDMGGVGCITSDSGVLVIGNTSGTGQCGFYCGLLTRLDKFGKIVWQKTIGSFYENYGFYKAIYNPNNGLYYALARVDNRTLNAYVYNLIALDEAGTVLNAATFIAGNDTASTQSFRSLHILADSTIGVAGDYASRTAGTVPVFYTFSPTLEPIKLDSFLWNLGSDFNGNHHFFQRELGDPIMLLAEIKDTIVGLGTSIFEVKTDGSLLSLNRVVTNRLGLIEPALNGNWLKHTDSGIILFDSNYLQIEDKQMPEANDFIVSSAIQLPSGSYVMSGLKYYYSPQGEVIAQRPHVWQTDQRGWNVGIEQQAKPKSTSVSIYPNPAEQQFYVRGALPANSSITLTNTAGKVVLKQQLAEGQPVQIENISKGLLLYHIYNEQQQLLHYGKLTIH